MARKPLPRNRSVLEAMAAELRACLAKLESAIRAYRDLELEGMPRGEAMGEWIAADVHRLRRWHLFLSAYTTPPTPLTISSSYLGPPYYDERGRFDRGGATASIRDAGSVGLAMLAMTRGARELLAEVIAALDRLEGEAESTPLAPPAPPAIEGPAPSRPDWTAGAEPAEVTGMGQALQLLGWAPRNTDKFRELERSGLVHLEPVATRRYLFWHRPEARKVT